MIQLLKFYNINIVDGVRVKGSFLRFSQSGIQKYIYFKANVFFMLGRQAKNAMIYWNSHSCIA